MPIDPKHPALTELEQFEPTEVPKGATLQDLLQIFAKDAHRLQELLDLLDQPIH